MIHGLVDRPLTFTMDDLKRLPSVTRLHFIECAGNRASRRRQDRAGNARHDQQCAEWTGVLLSTLLKECGLKGSATWFVAEGAEEVKGASSMPIAKAMDDCIVAYGMNGEAVRPQNGFPLRLMVPGFEGIFHTKWLRRIKVVDRYYMNYNDFGHLDQDEKERGARLPDRTEVGHHVPVRRTATARHAASTRSAAWPGPAAAPSSRWRSPPTAARSGTRPSSRERRSAWPIPGSAIRGHWDGNETEIMSRCTDEIGQVQPTREQIAKYWNKPSSETSACRGWTTRVSPGGSPRTGA